MVVEVIRGLGLGGSESQLVQRVEYVERHPETGVRTLAVVNAYSGETFFDERLRQAGVNVDDIHTRGRWTSLLRVWRRAGELPPEAVVIVHSPWPAVALKLRKMFGVMPQPLIEVASSTAYARPMLWAGALLNRYADAFIAVSDDVAAAPTTRGARRVEVIHAGVDRESMRSWVESNPRAAIDYRARLGLLPHDRLVAMIGNLYSFKGQDSAVRAIAGLPGVHLVLAGDGPERGRLGELARESAVGDRIHLVGREPDAWRWAAVADVVVHSSRLEGLPIALVEARVLGTPAVGTDVGGIAAVLDSDPRSRVVPSEDPDALVAALAATLDAAPAIDVAFPERAAHTNEWDVARYVEDFYRVAGTVAR